MTKVTLNRDHLMGLLARADFFAACPVFAFLAEPAQAAIAARDAAGADCCGKEWKYMRGVVDALFVKILELVRTDKAPLEKLKDYLAAKKTYRPERVVLYYRRSKSQGKIAKLEF